MKRLRLLGKGIDSEPVPEPAMAITETKPIPKHNMRLINTLSKIDLNKKNKFIKF